MLELVEASDFHSAVEKICTLHLPDGTPLPVLVEGVSVKPQYRNPYAKEGQRLPFTVSLSAQQATDFVDGSCTLEFEDCKKLEGIDVSRVAPLGRNPAGAYYQIVFN